MGDKLPLLRLDSCGGDGRGFFDDCRECHNYSPNYRRNIYRIYCLVKLVSLLTCSRAVEGMGVALLVVWNMLHTIIFREFVDRF